MSRLLVSVRNVDEARLAWQVGADLIDVKEPALGSLGPASQDVLLQVAATSPVGVPLSAALGELVDRPYTAAAALPDRFQFAKIGLAGCRMDKDWRSAWADVFARLAQGTKRVAVAYADWQLAGCPAPADVIRHGANIGCRVVLIDTFQKHRGPLLHHLTTKQLVELRQLASELKLMFVLAGSLDVPTITELHKLAPDYFAVRGTICRPDRQGRLDASLLRALMEDISALNHQCDTMD